MDRGFLDESNHHYQDYRCSVTLVCFLGRHIRNRLDLVKPKLESKVCEKQAVQKQQHDQRVCHQEYIVSQQVMVWNLRPGPSWVPGQVPATFIVNISGNLR